MSPYRVELVPVVARRIASTATYIATEAESPAGAMRWLELIEHALDSLRVMPARGASAEENALVRFEVRRLVVGSHVLLYSIEEDQKLVRICGLRHGHQRPDPQSLHIPG